MTYFGHQKNAKTPADKNANKNSLRAFAVRVLALNFASSRT
jgi:hypothetical protein